MWWNNTPKNLSIKGQEITLKKRNINYKTHFGKNKAFRPMCTIGLKINWECFQGYEENIVGIRFLMITPKYLSIIFSPPIYFLITDCGFKKVFQLLNKGLE